MYSNEWKILFYFIPDKTDYNYSDSGTDSENEDTVMEKLRTRFGQLLIG